MSYYTNSNSTSDQDWTDGSYNSNTSADSSFFDEANWSYDTSLNSDVNTNSNFNFNPEQDSSYTSNLNYNSDSNANSTSNSSHDQDWSFQWTSLAPATRRRPSDRQQGPRICPICQQTFQRQRDMDRHTRNAHTSHKCSTCGREYSSAYFLQEHIANSLECSPAIRDSSACPVCYQRFDTWAEKNEHHWKVHVKQDIRPSDARGGPELPMTDAEYQCYLHYYGLHE